MSDPELKELYGFLAQLRSASAFAPEPYMKLADSFEGLIKRLEALDEAALASSEPQHVCAICDKEYGSATELEMHRIDLHVPSKCDAAGQAAVPAGLYKQVPTSCRCGGNTAWVRITESGAEEMIGCICHTFAAPATTQLSEEQVRILLFKVKKDTLDYPPGKDWPHWIAALNEFERQFDALLRSQPPKIKGENS